jgi:twinkle protein
MDRHYTVVPGQMTIITGWPSSGKSEWLDALLVNLMHQGWHTAIFSPENQPIALHAAKLLEKVAGMPFGAGPTQRIPQADGRTLLIDALSPGFMWVKMPDEGTLSAKAVIEAVEPWMDLFPKKKRGLVIDPWNELEHHRPQGLSETEYVSQTLTFIRSWARRNSIHVWLVAHPQKMRREDNGKLPVPRPDMISGSQHWWNKADVNVTVYRDMEDPDSPNVEIHIQKCRFKHVGRPGIVDLRFDRVTGRYHEPIANIYDAKERR